MGPIWGRQDPGGPHVGLVNLAIWVSIQICNKHEAHQRSWFQLTLIWQPSDCEVTAGTITNCPGWCDVAQPVGFSAVMAVHQLQEISNTSKYTFWISTHCGLEAPYGNITLGHSVFRHLPSTNGYWLGAVKQQAIIWAEAILYRVKACLS